MINDHEIPMLSELYKGIDEGTIQLHELSWVKYYISEERKKLGPKYAIISPWREVLLMRDFDRQIDRKRGELLWANYTDKFGSNDINELPLTGGWEE